MHAVFIRELNGKTLSLTWSIKYILIGPNDLSRPDGGGDTRVESVIPYIYITTSQVLTDVGLSYFLSLKPTRLLLRAHKPIFFSHLPFTFVLFLIFFSAFDIRVGYVGDGFIV